MQFVCFVICCAIVFIILYVFYWIVEINDVAKPKKDVFSGGEAGDIIIERSDGMKEEYVIYSEAWGKKNPDYVIINNEKISVGDKVWREEIGNMEVFIIEDCGNTIRLILKLEDNAIPSEIGRKFVHPLHTNWFKGNVPGLYHEIRVPYTDKKLENLVIGRFYKISQGGETMGEINLVDEKEKQFTKSDLKNGDIVELRNGERYVYIEKYNDRFIYSTDSDEVIVNLKDGEYSRLGNYDDDLRYKSRGNCEYDIMKILDMSEFYKKQKWTWEREKTEEMTLEEVCKELGKDIKIVKEH